MVCYSKIRSKREASIRAYEPWYMRMHSIPYCDMPNIPAHYTCAANA